MTERKSFILHKDSLSILDDLSDEQAGMLFKAIKAYHLNEDYTLEPLIKVAFSPFKNQFIRDTEKYQNVVERNRINGSKGGRPKNPEKPTGLSGNPEKPKKADSDSGSGSKSDSKSKSKSKKPTKEEVQAYMIERQATPLLAQSESERFINYYQANGWKVGRNPMKDWEAAVRNWMSRNDQFKKQDNPDFSKVNKDLERERARQYEH